MLTEHLQRAFNKFNVHVAYFTADYFQDIVGIHEFDSPNEDDSEEYLDSPNVYKGKSSSRDSEPYWDTIAVVEDMA